MAYLLCIMRDVFEFFYREEKDQRAKRLARLHSAWLNTGNGTVAASPVSK